MISACNSSKDSQWDKGRAQPIEDQLKKIMGYHLKKIAIFSMMRL